MSLFFKKEKEVRALIERYFDLVDEAMEMFSATMACYLKSGVCEEFTDGDRTLHGLESKADDLLRDIEKRMYQHALLPESRGDLLGLLEHFDKLPNLAETITFMLETQRIHIPEALRPRVEELLEVNVEAYRLARDTVRRLFEAPNTVAEAVGPVDAKESESDRLERDLIVDVFADDGLGDLQKILLREVVQRIGDLSDSAENVAGRLEIIALKRRV